MMESKLGSRVSRARLSSPGHPPLPPAGIQTILDASATWSGVQPASRPSRASFPAHRRVERGWQDGCQSSTSVGFRERMIPSNDWTA